MASVFRRRQIHHIDCAHAGYVGARLAALRNDTRAIVQAASLASKASGMIFACGAVLFLETYSGKVTGPVRNSLGIRPLRLVIGAYSSYIKCATAFRQMKYHCCTPDPPRVHPVETEDHSR
jgi:hypothetical protein